MNDVGFMIKVTDLYFNLDPAIPISLSTSTYLGYYTTGILTTFMSRLPETCGNLKIADSTVSLGLVLLKSWRHPPIAKSINSFHNHNHNVLHMIQSV